MTTAAIDRTYNVTLPNGSADRVNIFDMNLAMCCGGESYIQLESKAWIKAKALTITGVTEEVNDETDA